jgi:hypothetical protein
MYGNRILSRVLFPQLMPAAPLSIPVAQLGDGVGVVEDNPSVRKIGILKQIISSRDPFQSSKESPAEIIILFSNRVYEVSSTRTNAH